MEGKRIKEKGKIEYTDIMTEYNKSQSPLSVKSYQFAMNIVKLIKNSPNDWKIKSLFDQVLRSGTSIAANIHESEFAQSPSDFISKLSISLKEANESLYWLQLLTDTNCIDSQQANYLIIDCKEIIALLVASIRTTKSKAGL